MILILYYKKRICIHILIESIKAINEMIRDLMPEIRFVKYLKSFMLGLFSLLLIINYLMNLYLDLIQCLHLFFMNVKKRLMNDYFIKTILDYFLHFIVRHNYLIVQ